MGVEEAMMRGGTGGKEGGKGEAAGGQSRAWFGMTPPPRTPPLFPAGRRGSNARRTNGTRRCVRRSRVALRSAWRPRWSKQWPSSRGSAG